MAVKFGLKGLQVALNKSAALARAVDNEQKKPIRRMLLSIEGRAKRNVQKMVIPPSTLASKVSHAIIDKHNGKVGYIGEGMGPVFFEYGTGIRGARGSAFVNDEFGGFPPGYKPSGQMILPKNGKFMTFKTKAGQWVRTRQTRGQPPKPALRKAVVDSKKKLAEIAAEGNQGITDAHVTRL